MADSQEQEAQVPNESLEEELQESSEDDIRSQLVEDYGLNEEEQSDLIDKMVSGKLDDQKKLSTAIKQKRSWREKAEAAKPAEEAQTEQKPEEKPQQSQSSINEDDLLKKVDARFDERLKSEQLSSLDLSDELKKEVKDYAELKGVSIQEAADSSIIQMMKKEENEKVRNDRASISSTHKETTLDYSQMTPEDFDLTTKEGQEGYDEWKKWLKSR